MSVRDTQGQSMSGQTVTFATSAPSIATVSDQGVVTSPGQLGTANITASAGGKSAIVSVNVVAGPATAIVRTSPDPVGSLSAGSAAGDSVRYLVTDAFRNPRANEIITFTIAAGNGRALPAFAHTDANGRAATRFRTGTTVGQNTLTATVGSLTPISFSLTTVPSSISISSVTPSPITPGATVTINGTGFSATATEDGVMIDGVAATITSASTSQLIAVAPSALPCAPTHGGDLEVIVNGASGFAQPTVQPGAPRSVPVGSAVVIGDAAELTCIELSPASAQYIVNVLNTSQAASAVTPFRFSGATSVPAAASPAPGGLVLSPSVRAAVPRGPLTAIQREMRDRALAHTRVLEANRSLYRQLKGNRALASLRTTASLSPSARVSVGGAAANSAPIVGDTRIFRVIQFTIGGSVTCTNYKEITAKVVYAGAKAILYEDIASAVAGQMDSYFVRLGQEFDATMYRSDSTYFGDPLVNDPNTDADQHLNMVFTPAIPAGLAGFVITCDFFPRNQTSNTASNFGENFYAATPTVAGTGFNGNTADSWLRGMRSTVVHEVKHIAGFGARFTQNANDFEESWLEEGMAMTAEEVWARNSVYATTWKGNANYRSTLYCDVRPTFPECLGAPFVMFGVFDWIYDFLNEPESHSLFGRAVDSDFAFYGTAWSFIRWSADRFAASEASFLRGITQAFDVSGLANMSRQAGADSERMLALWSLSLYLDENSLIPANADFSFPSWNLRDNFRGMSADFPNSYPRAYPFASQSIAAGDFSIDNAGIHGGSYAIYDLAAVSGGTRAVSLSSNATANPRMRLVIYRAQ